MHAYLIIFGRREPQATFNTNLRNEKRFPGHRLQLFNVVSHAWCLLDLTDIDIIVSVRINDSMPTTWEPPSKSLGSLMALSVGSLGTVLFGHAQP